MSKKPNAAPTRRSSPKLTLTEFTAAHIADAVAATGAKKTGAQYSVPINALTVVPGFNLRITDGDTYKEGLKELCDSMLLEGYFQSKPLSVFAAEIDGKSVIAIIDGHRRYEAALMAIEEGAEIDTLPVVFKKTDQTDLDLAVAIEKENRSVPLSMLERGVLAKRMMGAGETEEAVAERLQVTVRHVNDLKILMAAPKDVRDLVKNGKVSATEAVAQLRKDPEGKKMLEAAAKAAAKAAETGAGGERSRVTRQTIEDGETPSTVKMATHRGNFQVKAGAEFAYEDAAPYLSLIGDETWFKKARKQTMRIALEDISIEVKVRRPVKAVEEADDAGLEAAEPVAETRKAPAKMAAPAKGAATNGKGKPAPSKAAAPAKTGRGRTQPSGEDLGLDDDDGGAPDLKALGIVDGGAKQIGL